MEYENNHRKYMSNAIPNSSGPGDTIRIVAKDPPKGARGKEPTSSLNKSP